MTSLNPLEHQLVRQRETARNFFWHRLRWQVLQSFVAGMNPKTFLDVGAGSGLFSQFVRRDYPQSKYFFVEPSKTLAGLLEEEFGHQNNLTSRPKFEDIDVLLLLDVLEHIENDKKFIADLVHKMKPGAKLLLTVPALDVLWSRWDTSVGHLRRYSKKSLFDAFSEITNEVEINECQYLFWELFPLGLFRKWRLSLTSEAIDPNAEAEMPVLKPWVNELLYAYGKLGLKLAKYVGFGTSLALCATKK